MSLIDELVRIESADAVSSSGGSFSLVWSGSDEARAARAAIEERVDAIRREAMRPGIDGDDILDALDGDE